MKITNIDIIPANSSNTINLSFRDPTSQNDFVVKEILGLDAEEIVPRYYATGLFSNDKFYDLSLKKRDIVLVITLNPDFSSEKTYSTLRDEIYKLIASSRTGLLQLKFNDGTTSRAAISGFTTKIESPTFTKSPEIHIHIKCVDALLKALDFIDVDVTNLNPISTVVTDDVSTAPHGLFSKVVFTEESAGFAIKDNVFASWIFEVFLTGSSLVKFLVGDALYFSSETNNKYVYLERNNEIIHVVDRLTSLSLWPIIFPGENTFVCSPVIDWEYIRYYPTYWGI